MNSYNNKKKIADKYNNENKRQQQSKEKRI